MSANTDLIYLENDWIKASFLAYGASLVSLIYKPLQRECVCGFNTLENHQTQGFYLGNIVGRVANRIENGAYILNQQTYHCDINASPHHLHGGKYGLSFVNFDSHFENKTLVFEYTDSNNPSYPGTLIFKVKYELNQASLKIQFMSTLDLDGLVDPTLHSYFNLNPSHKDSIKNHHLKIQSSVFYGIDENGCTHDDPYDPKVLGLDSTKYTEIDSILCLKHPQVLNAKGIDHYFLRDPQRADFITLNVRDLALMIKTDLPGAHIYSGNYLSSNERLYADFLQENGGICFECHHIPNSINFNPELAPLLKANTQRISTIEYHFKENKEENK